MEKPEKVAMEEFVDCFFEEGFHSYEAGSDYEECPYDEGTDGEYGWKQGWKKAEKDNP